MVFNLAGISAGLYLAYFALAVGMPFTRTRQQLRADTMTESILGPTGRINRTAIVLNAFATILLLAALVLLLRMGWRSPLTVELALVALTRLLIAAIAADSQSGRQSFKEKSHRILAIISGLGVVSALWRLAHLALLFRSPLETIAAPLASGSILLLAALWVTVILPRLRFIFGLIERLLLIDATLGLLVGSLWVVGYAGHWWR